MLLSCHGHREVIMNGTEQAHPSPWDQLKGWLPVGVVAVGLVGTGYVTLERQGAQAEDLKEVAEMAEMNEEDIDRIQEILIERAGQVALDVQRLEGEIKNAIRESKDQGEDIDKILEILEQRLERQ